MVMLIVCRYSPKAKLLLIKLIHLFAREVLLVKKLEIKETKTIYYSTFKTDIIKVGLLLSISNFFFTKTSLANKWMRKKTLLAEIQLYTISKPNLQIKVNKTKSHLSLTIIFLLLTPQLALVVATKVVLAKLLWPAGWPVRRPRFDNRVGLSPPTRFCQSRILFFWGGEWRLENGKDKTKKNKKNNHPPARPNSGVVSPPP